MDGATTVGFASIGAVLVLNLVAVAFSYGKHTQKLNDPSTSSGHRLCQRVARIENLLNCAKSDDPDGGKS